MSDAIRAFLLFMRNNKPDECPAGDGLATTKVAELKDGVLLGRDCIGGFGGCCARSMDLEALAEELIELSGFPLGHTHRWGPKRGGGYQVCKVEACPAYLSAKGEVKMREDVPA